MFRRAVLTALAVLPLLAACGEKPMLGQEEPAIQPKPLQKKIEAIATRASPAALGVAVEDLATRQLWAFNGDRPFLLGAAARVPILAAVTAETAAGRLDPREAIAVRDVDLSPPPSAVADAWPGRRTYTVAELESLARTGDNTALDLLTRRIGGPGAVNGWLDVQRINAVSVDRYRRQVLPDGLGLASFRVAWRGEPAWRRALTTVPARDRSRAARERQADPRDAAAPVGMVRLLEAFNNREVFPTADARELLGRDPGYLASSLPTEAALWQAAGSERADLGVTPESHAVAIVELKDGRRVALAVFLTGSTATVAEREAVIAAVGRAVLDDF
ncbi:serine hydrolase [Caulobacter sp.]|uniref:serine hydrolase n=1 Tax=Caulobacter sp. TaxID=78 RepID=UPI002B4640E7|nr:serine hydrolase [Caulobacter sp.]HJV40968.1 serine hydrolase [Caulobacter sp.]